MADYNLLVDRGRNQHTAGPVTVRQKQGVTPGDAANPQAASAVALHHTHVLELAPENIIQLISGSPPIGQLHRLRPDHTTLPSGSGEPAMSQHHVFSVDGGSCVHVAGSSEITGPIVPGSLTVGDRLLWNVEASDR